MRESDPFAIVDMNEAAALGMKGLRMEARPDGVFKVGKRAAALPKGAPESALFTPAAPLLYDYQGERKILLPLTDGYPLMSEIQLSAGGAGARSISGGRVIYIHYNIGVAKKSQSLFDRRLMEALSEYIELQRSATESDGIVAQAFSLKGDFGPGAQASAFYLMPRPRDLQGLSTDSTATTGSLRQPHGPRTKILLPVSSDKEQVVYHFTTGKSEKITPASDGSLAVDVSTMLSDLVFIAPAGHAETTLKKLNDRRNLFISVN